MHKDVLIIGQGLAGTLLAHECLMTSKSVLVMDVPQTGSSSVVAAGMFTPVSGKRMAKSWEAEILIPFAIETYRKLEQKLNIHILHQQPIYHILASVKEQNDFTSRLDQSDFADYLNPNPVEVKNVIQPFGAFEVNDSGWVNLPLLLNAFRKKLQEKDLFEERLFEYKKLQFKNDFWHYNENTFSHVVFCEGHRYYQNPFFKNLLYTPTKGDVITIRCENLETERIIKKGIYLVPLGDNLYKAGATYDRDNINNGIPTASGFNELKEKLKLILEIPFEVVAHKAGIRPTTIDRKPLLGEHPEHKGIFIFNGLGTKGVMNGPWFAHILVKNIFEGKELPTDIRFTRMNKYVKLDS